MSHSHKITNENERKTLIIVIVTILTMILEVIYGYITQSMALLADGYHMGTHALALGLTYIAYVLMRRFSNSPMFPCGTDKIGVLTAYTSSLFLGAAGIWIIIEAFLRLFHPLEIHFNEAVIVALIGLLVNGLCIFIMEFSHIKEHRHVQRDYNFKAAYYHILADALTSILAIAALLAGKYFNFLFLDPVIGILGGILIINWAVSLLKNTACILIDFKKS